MPICKVIGQVGESAVHHGAEEGFVFVERFASTLDGVQLTRRFVELLPKLVGSPLQLYALSHDASIGNVDLLCQGRRAHRGTLTTIMVIIGIRQGHLYLGVCAVTVDVRTRVAIICREGSFRV